MKKLFLFILLISSILQAKLNITVSIPPEAYLLEQIAKDKVNILTVVKPGNSPHTYEPKPSQMVQLSKTDIYFAIGVEFESVWLNKFKEQNPKMKIVYLDSNITKIAISKGKKKGHLDPHIWLSVTNLKKISTKMAETLADEDKENRDFYLNNLQKLTKELNSLDKYIKEKLSTLKNRKFLIFHPSWGYFAKEYNLEQIAIEVEGKSPKPRELIKIIKLAKENGIKVIFTQPEFSIKSSQIIASEIGGRVVKVSPLSKDIIKNIKNFTDALVGESIEQ